MLVVFVASEQFAIDIAMDTLQVGITTSIICSFACQPYDMLRMPLEQVSHICTVKCGVHRSGFLLRHVVCTGPSEAQRRML